jgi:hypothetical protein
MHTSKGVLANPFVVFGAAVVAFATWLSYDATHAPAAYHPADPPEEVAVAPDPVAGAIEARLGTLKPGVPRLTAEQQLMTLPAPDVEPVDLSAGRPVFRERYRLTLEHPVALLDPAPPAEFVPGPYVLTVEFDGAAAGHPLSRVALAPAVER